MFINVYHDTVCPFCRIGKRNLEIALARWQGEPVEVSYRSFFLNSNVPPEGVDYEPYMREKVGGGTKDLATLYEGPVRMGEAVGLRFNFEAIGKMPNTMLSHRLIAMAPESRRPAVVNAIYDAYFEQGRDIGDLDVLVDIAAANGMDAAVTRRRLESDEAQVTVEADFDFAKQVGISGVPFFIINGKYAFSGARPPELILEVLNRVVAESSKEQSANPA